MIIASNEQLGNTAIHGIATPEDVGVCLDWLQSIAGTLADDLMRVDEITADRLWRLAGVALSALLSADRDRGELNAHDLAAMRRLIPSLTRGPRR